jgi:hypothetical protein
VLDVGCGEGHFLAEFKKAGVKKVLGLDGVKFDEFNSVLAPDEFIHLDLSAHGVWPIDQVFDVTLCLEVAEHLPESMADSLVNQLCGSSDIIVFSAAIPKQGGMGHLNEQWQSYWYHKFLDREFVGSPIIRNHIWEIEEVEPWYKQNIFLYARYRAIGINEKLWKAFNNPALSGPVNVVFPLYYLERS